MAPIHLNCLAILVAFAVVFVGGALWYSPVLFARRWADLARIDMNTGNPITALVGQAILTLIAIVALAVIVGWGQPATIIEGGCIGFLVGAGILATDAAKLILFEKRRVPLFLINQGYNVLSMVIAGMILAAMPPAM